MKLSQRLPLLTCYALDIRTLGVGAGCSVFVFLYVLFYSTIYALPQVHVSIHRKIRGCDYVGPMANHFNYR